MSEVVVGIIIGLFTLLGTIIPSINSSFFENKKLQRQLRLEHNRYISEQKRNAYAEGLEALLRLRKYFNVSKDQYDHASKEDKERIADINEKSLKAGASIRLYSTDEIADEFAELAKYSQFTSGNKILIEQEQEGYVDKCNGLAKKMREDLNKYNFH